MYDHPPVAFVFECSDHAFHYSDTSVLADGTISWRFNFLAFMPIPKRQAVEDTVSIAHDVFRPCVGDTHCSSMLTDRAQLAAVGGKANKAERAVNR